MGAVVVVAAGFRAGRAHRVRSQSRHTGLPDWLPFVALFAVAAGRCCGWDASKSG
ncbi:putative conserved alanine rich membrane protein [Mycobacterium xenopi 4042]|uniref:Putative conserved alanine rich membrane protein n=1 Tax=Mycobacterium xenopi 4042 TaxID=1299334 RepID=X8CF62_MYCXE|nr:putative conserved alanine rich membrane protein [Mycobacterium xenopi 4042]